MRRPSPLSAGRATRAALMLLLAAAAPRALAAQQAPEPALRAGARVRIHAVGMTPSPWTGRLAGIDSATLYLEAPESGRAPAALPRRQVTRIERSDGAPGRTRNLVVWTLAGATLGVLVGPALIDVEADCTDCSTSAQRAYRRNAMLGSALGGTVVGLSFAMLTGPRERWVPVALPVVALPAR